MKLSELLRLNALKRPSKEAMHEFACHAEQLERLYCAAVAEIIRLEQALAEARAKVEE